MPAKLDRRSDLATLTLGLRAFAEMLDTNREMMNTLRKRAESKDLKGFQSILGNRSRLAAALSTSSGSDVSMMFSAIQQLGEMQSKLSRFAALGSREQSSVIKQVGAIARDVRNAADRLEQSR